MASKIPDNVLQLLAAADKRQGFPSGTMASVMQQEVGGQFDKYLGDPSAYHYEAGPDGRRVAGHTGKVSTAFGPFGIVESTAADPGYGVKPLASKDLDEQIRFASDYLAARSKSAGGLDKGLAGYGEGAQYAQQVAARRDTGGGRGKVIPAAVPVPADPVVATAAPPPNPVPPDPPVVVAQESSPVVPQGATGQDPWQDFLAAQPQAQGQRAPVQVADLAGFGQVAPLQVPNFQAAAQMPAPRAIDFRAFGRWGARA